MSSSNSNNNNPLYLKRSEAAKKGWVTRRANMAARQNVDRNYEEQRIGGRVVRVAHQGNAIDYAIDNHSSSTPERILEKNRLEVFRIIQHENRPPMKINFKLHIEFQHINNETGEVTVDNNFMSSSAIKIITLTDEELIEKYNEAIEEILQKIFEYVNKGSGWTIKSILGEHLHISHYDPINGSNFIELPDFYKEKRSLVNIKNRDNLCGKWAIVSSLHQKEIGANIGRVSKKVKKLAKNYNWENIDFPLTLEGIKEFEKNNKEVGIIAFTTQGDSEKELEKITPLYISKREETLKDEKLAKIFVILGHYCVITDEVGFLGEKQSRNADLVCRKCLHKICGDSKYFAKDRLERHRQYCNHKDYCRENFPKKGEKSIYKFRHQAACLKLPMIVSADFECILPKIPPPLENQKTIPTQMHIPISFGLNIDRFDGKNSYTEHIGLDSPKIFVEKIEEIAKNYLEELGKPSPMLDIEKANKALKEATECWICGEKFGNGNLVAVRDHDHYTRKFRGIAHSQCNLELQRRKILPVFFHGLSNYDESLFFRELNYNGGVKIIPKNEENFISFQKTITLEDKSIEIRFLDSFRFMSASLANLVEITPKEAFKNLRREFPEDEKFNLLCQKGIFFYDYFDSMNKLEETKLPNFEHWYNALDKRFPTKEEIERAHQVWKIFDCKTLRNYVKLYQKSDVLLLADVLEYFREKSLRWFGLDPAHFITTPSLGINALLKKTKIEFPLFTEEESEMYRMCEMLIRGGICNAPTRYAEANNKYMENYDPSKPSSFIKNLDTNSLYPGIMADVPLPDGNFKMMNEKECKHWEKICEKDGIGCILFVDLDYPWKLHDLHNEFPLAVEKGEKLTPTLSDKKFYPTHYRNLKYYIEKGLVLKKIHSGIKFTESCWMKPYVIHCIGLRQEVENDFDREFLKLMMNSPFGKCMENVRKRANIVCGNDENFLSLVQKPAFKGRKILSENLSLNHFKNLQVTLNKPIILGACILELSKLEMARKYDGLKEKYTDKMSLLYTDTDSLFPHIYTEDWYQDIKDEVKEKYDTSNIPEDHEATKNGFPVGVNKKVLHMLKDECRGKEIGKLVALGPKLYSYDKKVKAKGIKKSVIKNELTFKDLNQCRLDEIPVMKNMNLIKSIDHNNLTINVTKVALKANDDKRFVLEDKIHTLAPGHWRLLKDGTSYIPFSIPLPKKDSLAWKSLCCLKGV